MNRYLIPALLCSTFSISCAAQSQQSSVSTQVVQASYFDDLNVLKEPCLGKVGSQHDSYISMSVDKIFVRKEDGVLSAMFDSKRSAYPIARFSAEFSGNKLSINKVTSLTRIYGSKASADLVQGWELLDRLPYSFLKPKIELIIASNSDSNIDNGISMFKDVTSAIPDATVTTSATTAMAIAAAFDKYFLAPDRTVNALKAEYEFPLAAGKLCEGAYVVFAAKRPETYQKYLNGNLKVKGNLVTFNDTQIKDLSYAIFRLKITDRYYGSASKALDDTNKVWATHFNKLSNVTNSLLPGVTAEKINEFKTNSDNSFLLGQDYLMSDPYLLIKEKWEILTLVSNNYQTKLTDLQRSISTPVVITNSTALVLQEEVNGSFDAPDDVKAIAQQLENGDSVTLNRVPSSLRPSFKEALESTSGLIQEQVEMVSAEVKASEASIQ